MRVVSKYSKIEHWSYSMALNDSESTHSVNENPYYATNIDL